MRDEGTIHCVDCWGEVRIDSSADFAKATCRLFGRELWVVRKPDHLAVYDYRESAELRAEIIRRLSIVFGVSPETVVAGAKAGELFGSTMIREGFDIVEMFTRVGDDDW
jgi:hypothetical protein